MSYGEHNQLQKAIIENFLAIYGKGCEVLYVGDSSDKLLYKEEKVLQDLNFFDLDHDELPDVIAYNKEKNLLFLIEAFHCTGQWDNGRTRQTLWGRCTDATPKLSLNDTRLKKS